MEVRSDTVTTVLYFDRGALVFAEQGTLGETLGRMLVREGRLSQEQFAKVIEKMTASLVDSETMRFGEAAIVLGFLSPADVHDALALQVKRKLVHCFQWEVPACSFYEDAEVLAEVARFPTALLPLVIDGIRQHYDRERTDRMLEPFLERVVKLGAPAPEVASELALHPKEARFLREIDGTQELRALLARTEVDALLATRLCAGAIATGHLRLIETESEVPREVAAAPAPTRSAADALVHELARRRAQELRRSSRPPPDAHRARLLAEQHHQRGRRHMAYDAWAAARDELRRAAKLCPDVIEYAMSAAWASYRAEPSGDDVAVRERLGDLATRALKEDRENAFAWYVLGQIAMLAGDDERALKSFRVAQRIDPDDIDTTRCVRLLSGRLGKDKKRRS